jgi:hypothetical protein
VRWLVLVAVAGCTKIVETASRPTTVRLHFTDPCAASLVIEHATEKGFEPVVLADARARIDVPSMDGGYSERAGHQSNVHDPSTYPIVRISSDGNAARELSLADIDALPHDPDGAAKVSGVCKAAPIVVEPGPPQFGCIGWSPAENAVVCITGAREWGNESYFLETLGPTDAALGTELTNNLDDATATRIATEITAAHFVGLTQDSVSLDPGAKTRIGGADLQIDVVETDAHTENTAPTVETVITATCGSQRDVLLSEKEEGRAYQAAVRTLGARVLVEVTSSLAREGEYGSGFEAFLLDPTTCTFESSAGAAPSSPPPAPPP